MDQVKTGKFITEKRKEKGMTQKVLVLVMLLATGNLNNFFQSFGTIRAKDVDRNRLFSSLQAVKLAIASYLLGGGY